MIGGARIAVAIAVLLLCAPAYAQEEQTPPSPGTVLTGWLEHVAASGDYTDAQKRDVARLAEAAETPEQRASLVADSLAALYPGFGRARALLGEDRPAEALDTLVPLLDADDPYLAANARWLGIQTLVREERYEDAEEALAAFRAGPVARTQYGPESLLATGIVRARLVRKEEAEQALLDYLARYPDAPPERRRAAARLVVQLRSREGGDLALAHECMGDVERRLRLGRTGEDTRAQQERIVGLLTAMVEAEEQRRQEQQAQQQAAAQQSGSAGAPTSPMDPSSPASISAVAAGRRAMGELGPERGTAAEGWGGLPEHEREAVLSELRARFPARYQDLVEQYFTSLQSEEPE